MGWRNNGTKINATKNKRSNSFTPIFFICVSNLSNFSTDCHWKTNAISDITYGENKSICFKTKTPGIFALFQKTYINMPFRSWEIRPKAENCCYLIISGPKTEVEFEFKVMPVVLY